MKKFSLKLRHKILLSALATVFISIIFIFNLSFIFQGTFLQIKNNLAEGFGSTLDKKVSIEKIKFLPYGELILDDIKSYDEQNRPYVNVNRCHIKFRLLSLFINKTFFITEITLIDPVLFPLAKDFKVTQKEEATVGKYKLAFSEYLTIKVKSGKALYESPPGSIGFSFLVKLREGKKLQSEGLIDLSEYHLKDYLLNDILFFGFINKVEYRLKISVIDDTLLVDEFLLDFEQFKVEAKGLVEDYKVDPVLNLKFALKELGFSEKLFLKSKLFISNVRNFIIHIKGAIRESRWSIRLDELRSKMLYASKAVKIDNFYCDLKFSKEGFLIEDFNCFLNNFPVGLKCKFSNPELPYIELRLVSYPDQLPSLRRTNPLNFDFSFSGYKHPDSIKGKMSVEIDRLVSAQSKERHGYKLVVDDLFSKFLEEQKLYARKGSAPLALMLKAKSVAYESNISGKITKLDIINFISSLYPEGTRVCIADMGLEGYEGSLKGSGFLDFKRLPPEIFFNFDFDGVNLSKLTGIFKPNCDLAGSFSGEAILNSEAPSFLSGKAHILNGYIKNLKLLDLMADFLSIVSLKDIYFENFSSNFSFSITGDETSLDGIKLDSENIYAEANLQFKEKGRMNGNALVRLSTEILKESFKMRLLLSLIDEEFSYADFEFKIGGFIKSPHIKWLDTAFKKNLVCYLSKKGQEVLEEEVEKAVEPLLKSE